jgi:4'-phosphopantetheinyl transferase EntD
MTKTLEAQMEARGSSGFHIHSRLLSAMYSVEVATAAAPPRLVDDALFPEELRHVERAVDKRRAEFGTARVCARRALSQLGAPNVALVPRSDRSPRWPAGFVGSISHTKGCCAAVVARARATSALGLDMEQDTPLKNNLIPATCTLSERQFLLAQPKSRQGRLAKVFFSAKEAFYKCQYPLTKTFLDFQQVELHLDATEGTFAVSDVALPPHQKAQARRMKGRVLFAAGLIVTAMTLEHGD